MIEQGPVRGLTVAAGAQVTLETTAVSGLTVSSGTILTLSEGGKVLETNILSGGKIIFDGGSAPGLTAAAGAKIEVVTSLVLVSGMTLGNIDVMKGGSIVLAGGTFTALDVAAGGKIVVAAGGDAAGLRVSNGVTLTVSGGDHGRHASPSAAAGRLSWRAPPPVKPCRRADGWLSAAVAPAVESPFSAVARFSTVPDI